MHRHEEFASGCEATCNGPFGGAWSKTMVRCSGTEGSKGAHPRRSSRVRPFARQIGYGGEATHFALELTVNYGVPSYKRGNDLVGLTLSRSALKDASGLQTDDATGLQFVSSPDGYKFFMEDAPASESGDPFQRVTINVTNLDKSAELYSTVFGASVEREEVKGRPSLAVRFAPRGASLRLLPLPEGTKLDRAEATGRYAVETEDGAPDALATRVSPGCGATILHGPMKLQPHGEEVLIVQDSDGHELCFVDARGYRNCIAVTDTQGGTVVDWGYREKLSAAAALTGKAAEQAVAEVMAGAYDERAVNADIDAKLKAHAVVVFAQTTCKYCAASKEALTQEGATFEVVNLDTLGAGGHALRAELAKRTGRSSVPQVFVGGAFVGGYSDGPGLKALQESGELKKMLAKAGAL